MFFFYLSLTVKLTLEALLELKIELLGVLVIELTIEILTSLGIGELLAEVVLTEGRIERLLRLRNKLLLFLVSMELGLSWELSLLVLLTLKSI